MMNVKEQTIDWAILKYDKWQLYVAKSEKGLCYVGSPGQSYDELKTWIQKRFPLANLVENEEALKPYLKELYEYFGGNRQTFSLPVDVKGTPFQQEIWAKIESNTLWKNLFLFRYCRAHSKT